MNKTLVYVCMYMYFIHFNIIIWCFCSESFQVRASVRRFLFMGCRSGVLPELPLGKCVRMYVCMESIVQYLCMYNLLYVCTYVYLCLRLFSFLFVAKHYVSMYVCMYVCLYVFMCVWMYVCSPRTVWVQREAGRSGRSRTRSSTSST